MGRNALIAAVVLLLGIATATAVVRSGDHTRNNDRVAQSGPDTSTAPTPSTTSTAPTTSTTAARGESGLAAGDAGQVVMGPTIPNTGVDSAIGPSTLLIGAGMGLRGLLGRRRAP